MLIAWSIRNELKSHGVKLDEDQSPVASSSIRIKILLRPTRLGSQSRVVKIDNNEILVASN